MKRAFGAAILIAAAILYCLPAYAGRDGAGTYTCPVSTVCPAVAGTPISPTDFNGLVTDIVSGLNSFPGTAPNHALPISKGVGAAGADFVGPCLLGTPIVGGGVSADPTCSLSLGAVTVATPGSNANSTLVPNEAWVNTYFSTLAGPNTWTGDNFFQSGRPWCDVRAGASGAKGDGVTDDSAAFNACKTTLVSLYGGGIIYVPPSNNAYCLKTGYSNVSSSYSTGGVILWGGGTQNTIVSACGSNTAPVLNIDAPYAGIQNLSVYGFGLVAGDNFPAATQPALYLGSTNHCVSCFARHVYIAGGTHALELATNDIFLDDVVTQYAYGEAALAHTDRAGLIYSFSSGVWLNRVKADQVWPIGNPARGATAPAWQNAHVYASGDLAVFTCGGQSYIYQTSGGTSAGSQPACKIYGQAVTDNTATWYLAKPITYYSLQLDTGVAETAINFSDFTGSFDGGVVMTNTFGVTAPSVVKMANSTISQTTSYGVYLKAGSSFLGHHIEFGYCVFTGCGGILTDSSWAGPLTVTDSLFYGGSDYGIFDAYGAGGIISHNQIFGAATTAIQLGGGVGKYLITGNYVPTANAPTYTNNNAAIVLQTGAGDYISVTGNNCSNAAGCIANNATGLHNYIIDGGIAGSGTPGGSSGQLQINSSGSFGGIALGGDCTFSTPNVTCTKTNGTSFVASATTDTTNAANIASGNLALARLGSFVFTPYTPTITCAVGAVAGYTTQTGGYLQVGKFVMVQAYVEPSGAGTCSGNISMSLPVNVSSSIVIVQQLSGSDTTTFTPYTVTPGLLSASTATFIKATGSTPPAGNPLSMGGSYIAP